MSSSTQYLARMGSHGGARRLQSIVAVTIVGAGAIGPALAPARTGYAAAQSITPKGAGEVKLGETYTRLRRQRLVGKIRAGCNLSGPKSRSAGLGALLRGSVDFTPSSPRKVANISVSGGGTARGVGIGAALANITAAYPQAQVDHTTEGMFGITLVKIPPNAGGKLQFAVDTMTKKISMIGVPAVPFCE